MSNKVALHQPVLVTEAIAALAVESDNWYIDATFGRGGYTREILKQGGRVIAFDHDEAAIEYGYEILADEIAQKRLHLIRENFAQISQEVARLGVVPSGIVADLGTSVDQLLSDERGFGFQSTGPLDMRMDQRLGVTAADLLLALPENQLATMFFELGGEEMSRRLAREIKQWLSQRSSSMLTAKELAEFIESHKPRGQSHLHPATKIFQALRMAVNVELDNLLQLLREIPQAIPQGRVVFVSFHEGEDRLVKRTFIDWHAQGRGLKLTDKPITPSEAELSENPRSRSAKMRVFELCPPTD